MDYLCHKILQNKKYSTLEILLLLYIENILSFEKTYIFRILIYFGLGRLWHLEYLETPRCKVDIHNVHYLPLISLVYQIE